MGAWGTALYSDDYTADLKDDYMDYLRTGSDPSEAVRTLEAVYHPNADDEEGHLFWLVVADIQWRYGLLTLDLRDKALHILDSGVDLKRWEDSKDCKKREAVLNKLRSQILQPVPPPKKITPLKSKLSPWRPGDLLQVRMERMDYPAYNRSEMKTIDRFWGKYALIQIAAVNSYPISHVREDIIAEQPIFLAYRWWGDEPPNESIVHKCSIMDTWRVENFEHSLFFRLMFDCRNTKAQHRYDIQKVGHAKIPLDFTTKRQYYSDLLIDYQKLSYFMAYWLDALDYDWYPDGDGDYRGISKEGTVGIVHRPEHTGLGGTIT